MSDAKVVFHRAGGFGKGEVAPPGEEAFVSFRCPNGNTCGPLPLLGRTNLRHDPNNQNGGRAHWDWDGNREAPTFRPSVNCHGCWHGYIEKGRCVNTGNQDEPEPAA